MGLYLLVRNFTIVPSFVDTNILIYAIDRDARDKNATARELITRLWEERCGVLSVQVLQEFYVNATQKLKKPMPSMKALELIEEYATWTVVENTRALLVHAISLQHRFRLSFWDAMIVQAALESGCETLFSEDLTANQRFGELRVVNPFKAPKGALH
jgi:predicted nucleic acid-binding protein